ncbi:hypothetical protein JCM1841_005171 [Sporobolomyces salmonicolor]
MSTSAFLPDASSSFATSSSFIPSIYSSHSHEASSCSHASTSASPTRTTYPGDPSTRSSPHSSSCSVASTASSSSPTSSAASAMTNSSFEERGRLRTGRTPRSAEGSVGSLATTVSPGPEAVKENEGEPMDEDAPKAEEDTEMEPVMARRRRNSSGMDISSLSMKEKDEEEAEAKRAARESSMKESGGSLEVDLAASAGRGQTRRASVLSSSSSTAQLAGSSEEGSKSGRRKAARMGSFHAGTPAAQAGSSGPMPSTSTSTSTPFLTKEPLQPPQQPLRRASSFSGAQAPSQPTTASTSSHHVDIVSYPSNDLLRLLASLLEQIAQANDARNARTATASVSSASSASVRDPSAPVPTSASSAHRDLTSQRSEDGDLNQSNKGRFDAAPLNSPVTPRIRRAGKIGGAGGPGILDNALNEHGEYESPPGVEVNDEMPLTPGVDLLREVGEGGGVEGFMPSLGGTHQPMPLSRRRGSSFIRNKRSDESSVRPSMSRQSTSAFNTAPNPSSDFSSSSSRLSSGTASNSHSHSNSSNEPPLTSLFTASAVALSSPNATLCFHARNVPAISIEAYLLRILKYCPTTNEVFLALLVYFDRMARIGLEAQRLGPAAREGEGAPSASQVAASKLFAIDSFNVHRLVIAGVTVASKFFSDVFYTNSRYAKVGGLPLHELNQLELQFLLLNDFRLKIPTDELQRYADQLILFWIGRNGTSNPSASAAAAAARPPPASPSQPQSAPQPNSPTPTHAPSPSALSRPPATRLTHSAVAAHQNQHPHPHAPAAPPTFLNPFAPASATPASALNSTSTSADVRTPTMSSSAAFARAHPHPHRPRSIRSQPSSSGTSVTSTITPGTPSTQRGGEDSESNSDAEELAGGATRGRGRYEPDEDGHYHDGWSSSSREGSADRDRERERRGERDGVDVEEDEGFERAKDERERLYLSPC